MAKILYFAGLVVQTLIRAPYERGRRRIPKTDQRVTRTERVLLIVLFTGSLILPAVYALTGWLAFANYPLAPSARELLAIVGAVFLIAGLWLFWRSHHDLGLNWSPSLEIGAQHQLITNGVYRAVRHPMYTSQLLMGIAQALLLQNWIAGLGGLIAFVPLYLVRIPGEERMMLDHFGDTYRAYSARTGRVLPRLTRQ